MNQEQNNLNPNNFNTQGNNGIPNNQPLNNQSFNQGMGFNQQPINPQPQPTPSFQQPIMQEPIPQPTNTFDSGNDNNQSFNSKPPKKMNLGLIIGIVVAIAVIGVVTAFGIKLFSNGGSTSSNKENNYTDNIKKGNVELAMTSSNAIKRYDEGIIYYENYEYFETKNSENEFIVVDSKGKQVLPITNKKLYGNATTYYKYLGDGYFIYNTYTDDNKITAVVVKDGKLIVSLDSYSDGIHYVLSSKCAYKNGILYAGIETNDKTIAYDIKTKKELWQIDGTFVDGYVLDDDFIRVQTSINPSGDNSSFFRDPVPNTIVDYDGNKIISGADIEPIESFGRNEYDTQIYTSKASSYLEIKNNDYVKVYDLNKNLKTTISIKETDTNKYYFIRLLYSGIFIIEECQKQPYSCKDILYNDKGEAILTHDDISIESYAKHIGDEYLLSKNLDLVSTIIDENGNLTKYFHLIKNGEIIAKYEGCFDPKHNYGLEHNYLGYSVKDQEDSTLVGGYTYKTKIVNLYNMKEIDTKIKYTIDTNISNQSPNGEYIILTTGNDYFVYDNELNLEYESADWVIPVNEKYFLTSNKYGRTESEESITNLVNIETGKVNKLDVKGEYYASNAKGLVTYDGTNYYLYTFN